MTLGGTPGHAQSFAEVDAAVRDGIQSGIYPGAVVVIGRRDSLLYARGYGHYTWSPASPVPDPDSTIWDIASITKIVGTTSAAMRLVDRGKLDLDAPVRRYLPRFSGGPKNQVTVRMLLDHTSGLKSYVPFYEGAREPGARDRPALRPAAGPRAGRQRRVQRPQRPPARPRGREGVGGAARSARAARGLRAARPDTDDVQAAGLAPAADRAQRHLARASPSRATSTTRTPWRWAGWPGTRACSRPAWTWPAMRPSGSAPASGPTAMGEPGDHAPVPRQGPQQRLPAARLGHTRARSARSRASSAP